MGRDAVGNWRPYIDLGRSGPRFQRGGRLVLMQARVIAPEMRRMKLEEIRRHNSLDPELQDTDRIFLRWSETAGAGEFNPEADVREIHYDPLPLEIQQRVTVIVDGSSWRKFIRKVYFTTLTRGSLAEQLGISTAQFKIKRSNALWFFKGRFEAEGIPMLASPQRARKTLVL